MFAKERVYRFEQDALPFGGHHLRDFGVGPDLALEFVSPTVHRVMTGEMDIAAGQSVVEAGESELAAFAWRRTSQAGVGQSPEGVLR